MSIIGKSLYASPFDPRMVPGCALWLDATDVTTMSLTGTNVTQWRDKSGNARHANPFCNAPTYSSAKQSLDFTPAQGLNSSLTCPTTDTGTPESAFIVVTFSNVGTAIRNTLLGGRGLYGRMYDASSTFLEMRMDGSTGAPYYLGSAGLTTAKKYLCYFQYAVAKEISIFNNAPLSNTVVELNTPFTARTTTIGLANGGASGLRGSLHEILVYSNTLSAIEKLEIGGYLAWKWGFTTDICAGHPYKYTTPLLRPFLPLDVDVIINNTCNAHWFDAADTSKITSSDTTLTLWSNIVDNRSASRSDISGITGVVSTGTTRQNGNNLIILPSNTNISFLGRFFGNPRNRFIATRPTLNTSLSNVQFLNQDLSAGSGNDYIAIESSTLIEKTQGVRTQLQTATIPNQSNQFSIYALGNNSGIVNRVALTGVPQTLTTSCNATGYRTSETQIYINAVGSQELGEWISINDSVETSDAQRIEGYLAHKWGIVNDLSTTHPFKLFPPLSIQFNPKQIANCSLWIDAADPSTVTLTGNVVTSLQDKGYRNITFSNGAGFTYNVTKFNGSYPSFYNSTSSGANILGVGTASASFGLGQTWFFVGNRNSIVASNYLFHGNTIVRASTTSSGSNLSMVGGTSGTINLSNANQFRSPFIGYFEFNSTASKGYINGSSNSNGTISNTATSIIRIGNGTTTPALPWNGHICEIIMYDDITTINASNLLAQKVEGYLAHKWGLTSVLPSTHTYKKFRP